MQNGGYWTRNAQLVITTEVTEMARPATVGLLKAQQKGIGVNIYDAGDEPTKQPMDPSR